MDEPITTQSLRACLIVLGHRYPDTVHQSTVYFDKQDDHGSDGFRPPSATGDSVVEGNLMFGRKKKEETVSRDFSDEFAALFERIKNLEARVEALERTVAKSSTMPPERKEGAVEERTG